MEIICRERDRFGYLAELKTGDYLAHAAASISDCAFLYNSSLLARAILRSIMAGCSSSKDPNSFPCKNENDSFNKNEKISQDLRVWYCFYILSLKIINNQQQPDFIIIVIENLQRFVFQNVVKYYIWNFKLIFFFLQLHMVYNRVNWLKFYFFLNTPTDITTRKWQG